MHALAVDEGRPFALEPTILYGIVTLGTWGNVGHSDKTGCARNFRKGCTSCTTCTQLFLGMQTNNGQTRPGDGNH